MKKDIDITYFDKIIHEMNNPINNLLLLSEIMLDAKYHGNVPEILENIEHMRESTEKLIKIVEMLKSVGPNKLGRIKLSLFKIDIVDVIKKEIKYCKACMIGSKKINFVLESKFENYLHEVDLFWFRQVISNLIMNAINHTEEGKITISIKEKDLNKDKSLNIKIVDDGMGINEDELNIIFDTLVRGSRSKNLNIPGSGIGLSVAKAVVEAHGGFISARNRPKGGAIFDIIFPIKS